MANISTLLLLGCAWPAFQPYNAYIYTHTYIHTYIHTCTYLLRETMTTRDVTRLYANFSAGNFLHFLLISAHFPNQITKITWRKRKTSTWENSKSNGARQKLQIYVPCRGWMCPEFIKNLSDLSSVDKPACPGTGAIAFPNLLVPQPKTGCSWRNSRKQPYNQCIATLLQAHCTLAPSLSDNFIWVPQSRSQSIWRKDRWYAETTTRLCCIVSL